jgi:riboflavin kinase/FMN adenylyltransferase
MSDKKQSVVMILGYFDSLHNAHRKIIAHAKEIADSNHLSTAIFTFDGNLKSVFKGEQEKLVYTLPERLELYSKAGIDSVCLAPVDKKFLSLSPRRFLKWLNKKFDIKAYVFGEDYRFGKGGKGNPQFLDKFAKKHKQTCHVIELLTFDGQKLSTTLIKELLTKGEIAKANALLGRDYFVTGEVFSDRKVGKSIGFPTINIKINKEKHPLKKGVYGGNVQVGDKTYKAVINYGARPTFGLEETLIEAHLIGFDGDLYGQTLAVNFESYLRDVCKFEDVEQLKTQIKKDILSITKGKAND